MLDAKITSIAQQLVDNLKRAKKHIAIAESCTGGLIAAAITSVPGSSDIFDYGIVAYANHIKEQMLGVPSELLKRHGAVSREVAEAMAQGALNLARADIAISTTGIAGPSGGSIDKPVGLVWVSLATAADTSSREWRFSGSRAEVREQAVIAAVEMALEYSGDE
ncbi:MAG: CinA family protein [Planctomycetes bacterium]|nr:CinA family protein [Planctomycetota bacterium]NUQ33472.1 CinA family protein [Planctomycetaceae bacterium]